MFEGNDLTARTIEVSALVKGSEWGDLLARFGVHCTPIDTKRAMVQCPLCGASAEFRKVKPVPRWKCPNGCQKQLFDSFLGLIRGAQQDKEAVGVLLGRVEAYLLERSAEGALPDQLVGFGKYKKLKWCDVPKNYIKWVVKNNIVNRELLEKLAAHLKIELEPIIKPKMIPF